MKTNSNDKQTQIYTIRVKSVLLDKLRNESEKQKRSMAKQIELILEERYKDNDNQIKTNINHNSKRD